MAAMTKVDLKEMALQLSPKERLELAAELWESGVEHQPVDIPDWHLPLIEKALAEHRRDPKNVIPGEEILARLKQPRT